MREEAQAPMVEDTPRTAARAPYNLGITLSSQAKREKFRYLRTRIIRSTKLARPITMSALGIGNDFYGMCDALGLTTLARTNLPTYRVLTLEFLSTF